MPNTNYSYVIDSSFRPFSMQEMLVPLQLYREEYEKREAAFDELNQKANAFDYLADRLKYDSDSKAAQIYKGYADELRKQALDFQNNGLNVGNKRGLLSLKRRYQGEIGRLVKADEARKAQIAEQHKIALQDPTRLFSRDASVSTLDDYLDNPEIGYKSYSGALLAQQVGQAASAIAKSLSDYGKGKALDGFTKTWLQQHGYTPAQVMQAIYNPNSPGAAPILNSIVEGSIDSSGLKQWADRATLNQAYSYARQGLWNAVGQTQVQTYTDEAAKLAAQEESQKRVAKYTAGLQNPTMDVAPKFDRRNVRTTSEVAADVKDKEMLEKYGNYFYKTKAGSYAMTSEGRRKYNETPYKYRGQYSTATNDATTEFKDWIDSKGLSEMAKGRTGKYQTSLLSGIMNRAQNIYDTTTAGEYTGLIDSSQYDNIIGIMGKASNNGVLKSYERRKKDNSYEFVPTEDIDVSKLTNADIKSVVPVYGIHGNYLEVVLKGGDRIIVPYNNLNSQYNALVTGNVNDARALEILKAKGAETFTYSDGRTVPIDVAITNALNLGYDNFMTGLGSSVVKNQETQRGVYQMR